MADKFFVQLTVAPVEPNPRFSMKFAFRLLLLGIFVISSIAYAEPTYTLTRTAAGEDSSQFDPVSISEHGVLASNTAYYFHGWTHGIWGSWLDLIGGGPMWGDDLFLSDISYATAINSAGQATGYAKLAAYNVPADPDYYRDGETDNYGPHHAVVSRNPAYDLGTLGGSNSEGYGINKWAQVAGSSQIAGNQSTHGFLSAANGGPLTDIGTLGGTNSWASAVNDSGQVVGWSQTTGNKATHAFFRSSTGGPLRDLGTLGGTNSYAMAVNSSGQVAGWSQIAGDAAMHLFLSAPNGGALKDLGVTVPSVAVTASVDFWSSGSELGMNDRGQIVGNRGGVPFLYTPGIGVQDVNSLFDHSFLPPSDGRDEYIPNPYSVKTATGINNLGQIAGTGPANITFGDGSIYVLSPINPVEAEAAKVAALSGATPSVATEAKASGGAYAILNATAAGLSVTYSVPVEVGTYNLFVRVKTGPARGIFQFSLGGANQGKPQDEYSSAPGYSVRNIGRVTFLTAGNKDFKFLVTGRNASSSGYSIALDYFRLVPTNRFETESLKVKAITPAPAGYSSAQWFGTFNATGASGGAGTYFNAAAPGNQITYTVRVAKTDWYQLVAGTQTKPDKGIFQLAVDGSNVGEPQDEYSPSIAYNLAYLTGYYSGGMYLSAGNHDFKFFVTGKNPNSTGYRLAFDYIELRASY